MSSLRQSGETAPSSTGEYLLGVEVLSRDRAESLTGRRIGILMNHASVDQQWRSTDEILQAVAPSALRAIFTPQHGFWGEEQANMIESPHAFHARWGIPIHSLYSETRSPRPDMLRDVDLLLVDLQDVGCRVYTFAWTMLLCLQQCAKHDIEVWILDRPNPLGGVAVEGPQLDPAYTSFVGLADIPMRHGLTLGELAQLFNRELSIGCSLQVIPMLGWQRDWFFERTGRRWLGPSPNLPSMEGVAVYPGQVLLEGTTLSEGRGTTLPFQLCGAPGIDPHRLLDRLLPEARIGAAVLPARFRPVFDKHADRTCGGVHIEITDRCRYRPVVTSLCLLDALRQEVAEPLWIRPPYEYDDVHEPIDILFGDHRLRQRLALPDPMTAGEIEALCDIDGAAWQRRVGPSLLYRTTPGALE